MIKGRSQVDSASARSISWPADLKAGSLSFTPQILSEENISPELGAEERSKGITASLVALVAVILAMCGYYRFAGFVACVAVFFNLLDYGVFFRV